MKISTWPFSIVAFLIGIAVLNVSVLVLAARGYGGMLDQHPYLKGLSYDEERAGLRRFRDSDWKAELSFSPTILVLETSDGVAVRGANVTIRALRPNDPSQDLEITLSEVAPGKYRAENSLAAGRWIFEGSIVLDESVYRIRQQIVVTDGRTIFLD